MKNKLNSAQYEAIMERINELMEIVDDNTPQTDKNYVELDFLTDLVVEYEKEHYDIGKSLHSDKIESKKRVFA